MTEKKGVDIVVEILDEILYDITEEPGKLNSS